MTIHHDRDYARLLVGTGLMILASFALGFAIPLVSVERAGLLLAGVTGAVIVLLAFMKVGVQGLAVGLFVGGFGLSAWNNVRPNGAMTWGDVLLVLAGVLILPRFFRTDGWQRIRKVLPIVIAVFVILLSGAIGALISDTVAESTPMMVRFAVAGTFMPVMVALLNPTPSLLRAVAWSWIIFTSVSGAYAIFLEPESYTQRVAGLSWHPNHLAQTLVVTLGLAIAFLLTKSGWIQIVSLGVIGLASFALLSTGSRAGILGVLVAIPMTLLVLRHLKATVLGVVLVSSVIASIAAGIVDLPEIVGIERMAPNSASSLASDQERNEKIEVAFTRMNRYPLGSGFADAQDAHNLYLQMMVIGGPMALLGMLAVIWMTAGRTLRLAWRNIYMSPERAGFTGGFAGLLAAAFFQNAIWDRYVWIIAALLCYQVMTQVMNASPQRAES